jgi:regulator of PEP synthase PpsR (kinase-PPPase family)
MKEINISNYSNLDFFQKEIKKLKKFFTNDERSIVCITRKSIEEKTAITTKTFDIIKGQKNENNFSI